MGFVPMPDRISPAFPCVHCGGEDWSYDSNQIQWLCNQCIGNGHPTPERPELDAITDFEAWHKSVMDDWETISKALADFEKDQKPQTPKEQIIYRARRKKFDLAYAKVVKTTAIASALEWIFEELPTGDIYLNFPEQD